MNAPAPCLKDDPRARKNHATILTGLARVGQVTVAEGLGIHESTVSKMKDSDLAQSARLLSLCGLKVVPAEWRCVDPKYMDAILTLAGQQLDTLRQQPGLVWEDEA